jgi:hypothetical protein
MAHRHFAIAEMSQPKSPGEFRRDGYNLIIRTRGIAGILVLILLATGCMGGATPTADPFNFPKTTPMAGGAPVTYGPIPTTVPYPIASLPYCRGLAPLPSPLTFDWPDIEEALAKLEDYTWGYYSCAMPQAELQAFLRQNMPKPPYLWQEVNGSEYQGGSVFLFFHRDFVTWVYIWMLPRTDSQMSYLVIAKGDPGVGNSWECRLSRPPLTVRAPFCPVSAAWSPRRG